MKKILCITIVILLIACKNRDFQSVDFETFAKTISDTSVVLLDVRTPLEYAEGHIPGAILIDATQTDFVLKAKQQLSPYNTVALYCRSGRRSKQAAAQLAAEGFKVIELNMGYISWIKNKE